MPTRTHRSHVLTFLLLLSSCSDSGVPGLDTTEQALTTTFYASPAGSGTTCSQAAPCSLTAAQTKVRSSTLTMSGDIQVNLLDGLYALSSTFILTESATTHDSGTHGFNVIYQAAAGAHPIISGGKSVTGWALYDSVAGIYRAPVPVAGLQTRQLYVNGVRATRARTPTLPPNIAVTSSGWTLPDSRLAHYSNQSKIEFVGHTNFRSFRCPVASAVEGTYHNNTVLSDGTGTFT